MRMRSSVARGEKKKSKEKKSASFWGRLCECVCENVCWRLPRAEAGQLKGFALITDWKRAIADADSLECLCWSSRAAPVWFRFRVSALAWVLWLKLSQCFKALGLRLSLLSVLMKQAESHLRRRPSPSAVACFWLVREQNCGWCFDSDLKPTSY